jgi:hypothetical protein
MSTTKKKKSNQLKLVMCFIANLVILLLFSGVVRGGVRFKKNSQRQFRQKWHEEGERERERERRAKR